MLKLPFFTQENYSDIMSKPYSQQNTTWWLNFWDVMQCVQPSLLTMFANVDARKLAEYFATHPISGNFPIGSKTYTMKQALTALKLLVPTVFLSDYFFRNQNQGAHLWIDIIMPEKTPIESITSGVVSKIKMRDGSTANEGNCVIVKTPDGYHVVYEHLSTIAVGVGDKIAQGQELGTCGTTGNSTQFHLHLQIDTPQAPFHPRRNAQATGADKYLIDPRVFARARSPKAIFKDMPYDHEQQQALIALKTAGIVKGSNGFVYPHNTLQRYEMALMIHRICKKYNLYQALPIQNPVYTPYTDVQINDPELDEALKALQKYAIMKWANDKFFPTQPLKGEELLAMLGRLFYGLHDANTGNRRQPYVTKFLSLWFIPTNRSYLGKAIPRKAVFVLERQVLKDKHLL